MAKKLTDDDIARVIGNRAISHLREMYPQVFAATYPSCRLSLRNHIRNDVNALLKAMRGNDRSQDAVLYFAEVGTDAAAGLAQEPIMVFDPNEISGYRFGMTKLDEIMTLKGIKNVDLAKSVGCGPPEISRLRAGIREGGRKMSIRWAKRLAPHLGCDWSDLVGPDDAAEFPSGSDASGKAKIQKEKRD